MPSSMSYMADGSPSSSSEASTTSAGGGHIVHTVSKLDTLAGVAIKYGVEVADVKRLNGLTTDLQMFALKRLRIPTPGRHPPSTATTTDPTHSRWEMSTALHRVRSQNSLVDHKGGGDKSTERSAAMDLLRGYYGLPASQTKGEQGTELASLHSFDAEDEPFSPMFPTPDRRLSTGTSRFDQSRINTTSSDPAAGLLMNPVEIAEKPVRRRARGDSMMLGSFSDDVNPGGGEIEVVAAAAVEPKDRPPVRRRARGDSMMFSFSDDAIDVSERVNFPEKASAAAAATKSKGPSSVAAAAAATNGWQVEGPVGVKTIGAALFGGKGAVEGLVSKVLQSTVPADKSPAPANTTTTSVLDSITQVYRRAKAALD